MQESAIFLDSAGNRWNLSINFGSIRRVQQQTGFDLASLASKDGADKLARDPMLFGDVLWWIVEPQARERGLDSDGFFSRLADEHLMAAVLALQHGLADFFPKDRGAVLRMMAGKQARALAVANQKLAMATEELNKPEVQAAMDQAIDAELERLFGGSAGNAAAV